MGTSCQNQPEVHALTQALHAVTRIAAPAMVFKAEAIVGPERPASVPRHRRARRQGQRPGLPQRPHGPDLVVARGRRRPARRAWRCAASPPSRATTAWATYVRCHDDIGWAIDDADAARRRLGRLLAPARSSPTGTAATFPLQRRPRAGVPARTRRPATGGSAARRRRSPGSRRRWTPATQALVDIAMRRLLLAHLRSSSASAASRCSTWATSSALRNDYGYRVDPAHADDNRWVHRPAMPWAYAERRKLRRHAGAPALVDDPARDRRPLAADRHARLGAGRRARRREPGGARLGAAPPAADRRRAEQRVLGAVQRWPLAAVPVGGAARRRADRQAGAGAGVRRRAGALRGGVAAQGLVSGLARPAVERRDGVAARPRREAQRQRDAERRPSRPARRPSPRRRAPRRRRTRSTARARCCRPRASASRRRGRTARRPPAAAPPGCPGRRR